LEITDTEEKLIAAAPITGESNSPNTGYSAPAATGTPYSIEPSDINLPKPYKTKI
jgi:hypothetical protein